MSIHHRSSLTNYTRFREQNGQSLQPFSKNAAKTLPFRAAHTYMAYIRENFPTHPPGRNRWHTLFVHQFVLIFIDFIDLYRKIHPFNCSSKNKNWIHAKSTFIDKWVAIKSRRIKQLSLFENSYLFFKIFWCLILARVRLHNAFLIVTSSLNLKMFYATRPRFVGAQYFLRCTFRLYLHPGVINR